MPNKEKEDVSHISDNASKFILFMKEFEKESDRASVILSAAMLDQALEVLLKARLVPVASSEDTLLEVAYAPISTFSARIDLAHRVGLISTMLCHDLHIIRRIRNEFAHNVTGCSFDAPAVSNRCAELLFPRMEFLRGKVTGELLNKGPKGHFQLTAAAMLLHLPQLSREVGSIEPAEIEWSDTGYGKKLQWWEK